MGITLEETGKSGQTSWGLPKLETRQVQKKRASGNERSLKVNYYKRNSYMTETVPIQYE